MSANTSRGPAVRIATAGWTIPRQHAHRVPEGTPALARYARVLNGVEINSSFWRRHMAKTWERWAATVPADFRFSVKVPRTITHAAKLAKALPLLDEFLGDLTGLGAKLGVVLIQLPPSLALEPKVARAFLAGLRRRWEGDVACEPRHETWFTPEADALLRAHRIARVAADPPAGGAASEEPGGDPTLAYFRLHGSPRKYWSPYGPERVAALAQRVRGLPAGARAWVVFDNTASGAALGDALDLAALLG